MHTHTHTCTHWRLHIITHTRDSWPQSRIKVSESWACTFKCRNWLHARCYVYMYVYVPCMCLSQCLCVHAFVLCLYMYMIVNSFHGMLPHFFCLFVFLHEYTHTQYSAEARVDADGAVDCMQFINVMLMWPNNEIIEHRCVTRWNRMCLEFNH